MPAFGARLDEHLAATGSRVCVGLDPVEAHLPSGVSRDAEGMFEFLVDIVDATAPYAAAFKPNSAFYEARGPAGLGTLERICAHVKKHTKAVLILDVKRGDVGHTAAAYAQAAFGVYRADAVTVSPYMGIDSVEPFAEDASRGVFVLARTSNPGAGELQDLRVELGGGGGTEVGTAPLYVAVARRVVGWNTRGNLGLVAGATWPGELRKLREAVGDNLPFLVPGVGAQGADARTAAQAAADRNGRGFLINSGRAVLHASSGRDYAKAAGAAAMRLRDEIRAALAPVPA